MEPSLTVNPASALDGPLRVDLWSDLVCPWCYVGRARFKAAVDTLPPPDETHATPPADGPHAVEIVDRAFELDPTTPRGETTSVVEMLARKFGGSAEQVLAGEARLVEMAAEVGLEYRADRLHGNTFDAHRLLKFAATQGHGEALLDRLYRANFGEGRSIFGVDPLVELAAEVGLDPDVARAVLDGTEHADDVRADEQLAASLGIRGVPFFVIDRRHGISGAQPIETFKAVLAQVRSA